MTQLRDKADMARGVEIPQQRLVLHVIQSLVGGAGRGARELVNAINHGLHYRARLCVVDGQIEPCRKAELPEGTIFLGCRAGIRRDGLRASIRLRRVICDLEPAILHLHLWPTVTAAATSMIGKYKPVIVHIRDTPPAFVRRGWRPAIRRFIYRICLRSLRARYVAVSSAAAQFTCCALGIDQKRMTVVLNGIDFGRLDRSINSQSATRDGWTCCIGAAGRYSSEKGHLHLIDAVANLRRDGYRVRLRIAGEGGLRADYIRRIAELGIGDAVELLGEVDDMEAFYRSLDIFALPSEREGLPRVLLEAMVCGIPCVATDCECVTEVIKDGENGLIVPRGDVPSLQRGLKRLCSSLALRQEFSTRGREHVQKFFSVSRVRDEIITLYDQAIASGD